MSQARPYDDLIMDHIKNARNYRVLEGVNRTATGSNPLCGDELTVYLRMGQDTIEEVSFQCASCGVAMASASIMTELIKGMPAVAVRSLIHTFTAALFGRVALAIDGAAPGQRAIIATVRNFPARARCAALPWTTLDEALEGRGKVEFDR
jgi:nitrogen fixation protein NifU and related proteins